MCAVNCCSLLNATLWPPRYCLFLSCSIWLDALSLMHTRFFSFSYSFYNTVYVQHKHDTVSYFITFKKHKWSIINIECKFYQGLKICMAPHFLYFCHKFNACIYVFLFYILVPIRCYVPKMIFLFNLVIIFNIANIALCNK